MILIALETTGRNGSLAIVDGETAVWQQHLGGQQRTAAEIAVQLNAALRWSADHNQPIEGIAVAVGPGSFTGLRIAITTAKTLAYALELPIVPVGSLAAIAMMTAISDSVSQVVVGLNAYRGQVFAAEFSSQELLSGDSCSDWNHRAEVWPRAKWDQRVTVAFQSQETAVAGDRSIFDKDDPPHLADRIGPDAIGVGCIAARLIADQDGCGGGMLTRKATVDAFSLVPRYVKLSAAEQKTAEQKEAGR